MVQSLVVFFSKRDTDDGFESLRDDISETKTEINSAFEWVEETIESMDRPNATTDGGWQAGPSDNFDPDTIDFDLEDASGAGALSGLVAGGALGIPFGPPGVIIGGLFGGLLGNAVEYQNLKSEQQEQLRTAVKQYIEQNDPSVVRLVEFCGVSEDHDEQGDYWLFEFKDSRGATRGARLYPDEKELVLVD